MSANGAPHGHTFASGVCNSQVPLAAPVSPADLRPAGTKSSKQRPAPPPPAKPQRTAVRKIQPSSVSWESPKWFRVPGVSRNQPQWKPPSKRDVLKHASTVSSDTPAFVQYKATVGGKEVIAERTAHQPNIYQVELSRGQELRGTDHVMLSPREVGDPRKEQKSLAEAMYDPNMSNAHASEWHSDSTTRSDLGRLFERNNVNLIEAFKTFDADSSGSISVDEFKQGLQSLQAIHLIPELTEQEMEGMVRRVTSSTMGNIFYIFLDI